MSGPAPKPTKLKLLQGNPGKRPIPKNEPAPMRGRPTAPAWLSKKAKIAFKELAGVLDGMQVLTLADRKALELLCDAYCEYRDARKVVTEEGATYETTNQHGDTMHRARPEVAIASDAWKRVKSMMGEFGLTPAARTRVQTDTPAAVDPMDDYLTRGKG